MTGGDGSKFNPMVFDSDDHSSEGETDDLIKQPSMEPIDNAEAHSSFKRPKLEASGEEASRFLKDEPKIKDDSVGVPYDRIPVKVGEAQQPPTRSLTPQQQLVLDLVREGKNVF